MKFVKTSTRNCTQLLYAIWESFLEGYRLTNLVQQNIYKGIEQLNKCMTDDLNQVSHCWSGNLWVRKWEDVAGMILAVMS